MMCIKFGFKYTGKSHYSNFIVLYVKRILKIQKKEKLKISVRKKQRTQSDQMFIQHALCFGLYSLIAFFRKFNIKTLVSMTSSILSCFFTFLKATLCHMLYDNLIVKGFNFVVNI